MLIRDRLRIISGISLGVAILMMISLAWTVRTVLKADDNLRLVTALRTVAYERSLLREEYIIYSEARPKIQWLSKTEEFRSILETAAAGFDAPQDRLILAEAKRNFEGTNSIFDQIINIRAQAEDAVGPAAANDVERRLLSQHFLKVFALNDSISRLMARAQDAASSARNKEVVLLVLLILAVAAATVGNSAAVNRTITKRIEGLLQGAEIIGDGNLGYRIGVHGGDELSRFAQAVNGMVARLQASHTSVNNLQREIEQRKQAEEELRENEKRFRLFYENSPTAYQSLDAGGNLIEVNQAWLDLLGFDREEVLGRWFGEFIVPEQVSVFRERFPKFMADGATEGADFEFIAKDGRHIITSIDGRVGRDESGAFRQTHCVLHNVTERVRAEEALRESEKKFRTLTEFSPIGIFLCDAQGSAVYMNERCAALVGMPALEAPSSNWMQAVHPDDRERVTSRWARAVEKKASFGEDYRWVHAGGKVVWTHGEVSPVHDGQGNVSVFIGTLIDITERVRAEEEIRTRNRIAHIFLTSATDEEMYNEVLNVVLAAMESKYGVVGYIDEEGSLVVPSMSRHIWDACRVPAKTFVFERDKWGHSSWPRAIRERKSNFTNSPSDLTPEGHIQVTRHISMPVLFQGDVIGLIQVANKDVDYTQDDVHLLDVICNRIIAPILNARLQKDRHEKARRLAEEALRTLNVDLERRVRDRTAQLVAANNELEGFSYSISHDLRAPLRHITGFAELLIKRASGTVDEKSKHYLDVISDAARQMGRLVDDLLSFSRMGRAEMLQGAVDLGRIVLEVVAACRKETEGRDVEWKVGSFPQAHGDKVMLRIVFENLLSNALKFSRTRSKAVIEVGCIDGEPDEVICYVRDNGVGFDMKYVDKLFGLFQRLHRPEEFEGTGLGLANVRRIIHRHGGRTWAEGAVNEGAAVFFSLPRVKEA